MHEILWDVCIALFLRCCICTLFLISRSAWKRPVETQCVPLWCFLTYCKIQVCVAITQTMFNI